MLKKFRRDIVKINPVIKINNKKENIANHSAPFPQDIPDFAIQFFSGKGDIVLDPFMGSGTTAISCMLNSRNYIGYELNQDYYKYANDRIDEYEQSALELLNKLKNKK